MKKFTLLLLVFLGLQSYSYAQCSRSGSFVAGPRADDYPISGTAKVEFTLGAQNQVIFNSDFNTVQGIRLLVFLSTDGIYSEETDLEVTGGVQLQDDNGGTDLGDPITGEKTFNIPEGVTIDDYDYIIVQCVSAKITWGTVNLGTTVGTSCNAILDVSEVTKKEFESIGFSPNPARESISIHNSNLQNVEIRIFDVLGNLVINTTLKNNGDTIDISTLSAGLYMTELTHQNLKKVEKLIIR